MQRSSGRKSSGDGRAGSFFGRGKENGAEGSSGSFFRRSKNPSVAGDTAVDHSELVRRFSHCLLGLAAYLFENGLRAVVSATTRCV